MAFWPFRPNAPIDSDAREWVHVRFEWLLHEFGRDVCLKSPVIEPTEEFFPDKFDGSESAVSPMLDRICAFMGVNRELVDLEFYGERDPRPSRGLPLKTEGTRPAGLYIAGERQIIALERGNLTDPTKLVATIAHELAHVRLLGEDRISRDELDNERVTDLTTVFFGLGIFSANSAFRFSQYASGGMQGWRANALGYLSEETFGYALAVWSSFRRDMRTPWKKHLRTNPRAYMKQTLRYLKANPIELVYR